MITSSIRIMKADSKITTIQLVKYRTIPELFQIISLPKYNEHYYYQKTSQYFSLGQSTARAWMNIRFLLLVRIFSLLLMLHRTYCRRNRGNVSSVSRLSLWYVCLSTLNILCALIRWKTSEQSNIKYRTSSLRSDTC